MFGYIEIDEAYLKQFPLCSISPFNWCENGIIWKLTKDGKELTDETIEALTNLLK